MCLKKIVATFKKYFQKTALIFNGHKCWTPRYLVLPCKTGISRSVMSVFALAKMATLSLKMTTCSSFTFIFKEINTLSDDLRWRHVKYLWQNNKKSGDF